MFEIVILFLLIVLNGLFAMSEAALISSRPARLAARAGRGVPGAARALVLTQNPTRFLSAVQIGITLISICAGAIGEKSIADKLQPLLARLPLMGTYSHILASVVMVGLLTYVSLVIGELIPKRLALLAPEAIASSFARPVSIVLALTKPLIEILEASTNLVIAFFPHKAGMDEESAEAEVRAILASGAQEGVFHESEQHIVERIFRLSDQTARSLMVPRTDIDFLSADDPVTRVRVVVATSSHSHFPVCGARGLDDLIGVLHVKDLVKSGLISEEIVLRDIARQPVFVPDTTPALELLDQFREKSEHIAFVTDEHGTLEGLVTLNDVVTAIIGEVQRHDETEEPMIVKRASNSFLLDGMLSIDELRRVLQLKIDQELPKQEEGYETLSGLMMTALGRIPSTGDVYKWSKFRFEIVDMDRKRVDKVMLTIEDVDEKPTGRNELAQES